MPWPLISLPMPPHSPGRTDGQAKNILFESMSEQQKHLVFHLSSHPINFEPFFISFFNLDFCLIHHLDEVRRSHIPSGNPCNEIIHRWSLVVPIEGCLHLRGNRPTPPDGHATVNNP